MCPGELELLKLQFVCYHLDRSKVEDILPSSLLLLQLSLPPCSCGGNSCRDESCGVCICRTKDSVSRVKRDCESRFDKFRITFTRTAIRMSASPVMVSACTVQFVNAGFIKLAAFLFVCQGVNISACGPTRATPVPINPHHCADLID